MKKRTTLIGTVIFSMLIGGIALAQEMSNYLITSNIGDFIASTNPTSGAGPGVAVGADHFYHDHTDMTYRISYYNLQTKVGPEVQITQHTGGDSDKWLLHEVDREFRNYYGIPGKSYGPRQIGGQTIIENLVAGGSYRWISGTKVIVIEYHDSQMTKPEPIEVIQAYLQKHPSTMQAFTLEALRSTVNKTTWIKDEMDRRLWLCDKWFMQLQLKKVEEKQAYQESVKSMNIFLNYREKYYGMSAANEKSLLAGYLKTNNGTGIKNKLAEYKNWWMANKTGAISL